MRITLDTNVLIRSHCRANGVARRLLECIERGPHVLVLSQTLLYEVEEVFGYPRVRRLTGLTGAQVTIYITHLANLAKLVDIGRPEPFAVHDIDDWMVLRTAIQGKVDVLCTMDGDLRHPSSDPCVCTTRDYGHERPGTVGSAFGA